MNYVRSHDDIGWTFADEDAAELGINAFEHRRFLNSFYVNRFPGSFARGVPFQDNPRTGDCRISGTTASLCGLEGGTAAAVNRILLAHSVAFSTGLVTPEIVMGVALLLLFLQVFSAIGIGTTTQAIGQVTFTISYVVVMVRGRLVSIGPEYEEAAADLGAPPFEVLWRVLLPLLAPAILASAAVVFALSIDDFVVTQYLSGDASTTTVSMLLYSSARGAPTPALNALATIALFDHARDARTRIHRLPALRRRGEGAEAVAAAWRCSGCRRAKSGSRRSSRRSARRRRRGRHRPQHAARRVLHDGRAIGLREDHDAAHDRGLRAARRAGASCWTATTSRRRRRTAATSTPSSRATRCSRT